MRTIALEEHMLPADLADNVFSRNFLPERKPPAFILRALDDLGEGRLQVMDAAGIDMQVLSATTPGSQEVSAADAVPLARQLNDRAAQAVRAYPKRFQALASLPAPDPPAAANGLQVVVGHMGENLPFSLMRADFAMSRARPGLPSVAETVRKHVHVTTCGYTTVPPLQCALSVMGVDRVLFSVDHPYADSNEATTFLAQAPISPADREKIAHGNAERLFKL